MVAIFSGVMLFISGTNFKKHNGGMYNNRGSWFSGINSQTVPNPLYQTNKSLHSSMWKHEPTTNYVAIFCASLLAVSGAGYFILGNEENKS